MKSLLALAASRQTFSPARSMQQIAVDTESSFEAIKPPPLQTSIPALGAECARTDKLNHDVRCHVFS